MMETDTPFARCEVPSAAVRAPLRILLAEDDEDTRHLIAFELRDAGANVVETENGRQALDSFRRSFDSGPHFDLIVSDFKMPKLSGLKLLSAVRESCDVFPFVLMTAYHDGDVQGEARRLGASAILRKPFDFTELRNLIRRLG